jgi:tRNA (cmo5U34)-methyltransferase
MNKNPFDKSAATWDEKPGRLELAEAIGRTILCMIRPTQEMDLLDYGCGTGLLCRFLLPHVRSVTGVDSSRGMFDLLQKRIEREQLEHLRAVRLDLEESPPLEEQFGVIVTSMTMHHVRNTTRVINSFHQMLRPGGQLCIVDLDAEPNVFHRREESDWVHHHGFDRRELIQQLEQFGFDQAKDSTAYVMNRELEDGSEMDFPIFAIVCRRP